MKPTVVVARTIVLLLFPLWLFSSTQGVDSEKGPLKNLSNPNWEQREAAFDSIKNDQSALARPNVRAALIELLDRENHLIYKTLNDSNGRIGVSQAYGEGYSEYLLQLLNTVRKIVDWRDEHQVCVLAQTAYEPGTVLASEIAVKGGGAAVPCLLKMAKGSAYGAPDASEVRINDLDQAIPVLVQIYGVTKDLSPSVRQQIHESIASGFRDSSSSVRGDTVQAAGKYGSPDLIPLLEPIAKSDAYSWIKDGKEYFEIRESAANAIRSIQDRAKSVKP